MHGGERVRVRPDMGLEPLPETREALAELLSLEDPGLDQRLVALSRRARKIVPDLVGLSLTILHEGVTFTLVAPNSLMASLDATQYVDGGPCVEVTETSPQPIETNMDDLLDEGRWSLFAQTSAASGVASTLSMPVQDSTGAVTGGINLYGSTPHAFAGRHEALALALDGSAQDMVTNADLGFSTRERAKQAPTILKERAQIDTAVGLLSARYDEDIEQAEQRLLRAATRAGVDPLVVARVLLHTHGRTQ